MTLQEFLEAIEEPGYRYELARGILEVTEVPNDPHGQVEWNLLAALRDYQREHPGRILRCGGSGSVRLWLPGMVSGRNPDVAVVLRGAPSDQRGRRIPSLAIEVVSVGGEVRDYETKRQEYLAYGLLEYWIVDPHIRRATVLVRRGDVWDERVFERDQTIESLVLPGFATPVSDLWADLQDAPEPQDP
jgi:Uma2 family endonuclease